MRNKDFNRNLFYVALIIIGVFLTLAFTELLPLEIIKFTMAGFFALLGVVLTLSFVLPKIQALNERFDKLKKVKLQKEELDFYAEMKEIDRDDEINRLKGLIAQEDLQLELKKAQFLTGEYEDKIGRLRTERDAYAKKLDAEAYQQIRMDKAAVPATELEKLQIELKKTAYENMPVIQMPKKIGGDTEAIKFMMREIKDHNDNILRKMDLR